jgi:hypothetical protein
MGHAERRVPYFQPLRALGAVGTRAKFNRMVLGFLTH